MSDIDEAMILMFYSPRGLARQGITDPVAINVSLDAQALQVARQMREERFGIAFAPSTLDRLPTDEALTYARASQETDRPTLMALGAGSLVPVLYRAVWA